MEIFDGSTAPVNYNYVFSSIPAARNKYAGLGRSTASAVLLVFYISIFFVSSARLQVATDDGFGRMIAQNACFCLLKCLLGVSLMVHHFWASRVRKTKNFHPRDRDFHVKLKR